MNVIYSGTIPTLWAAWFLYWLAAAHGAKPDRRRESDWSRLSHGVPLVVAVALLVLPDQAKSWMFARFMPPSIAGFWIGTALLASGLGFAIWARRRLGRNWSGTVTVKQDHELIQSGPYRFVRHPIYTGILTGFLGTAIALAEWRGLLAVLLATGAFLRKIAIEESWMREVFGERYTDYRRRVRALIPFIL